jgi:hypothetical protein
MSKNVSRPRSRKWLILGVAAVLLIAVGLLVGLAPFLLTPALAADLPKTIESAACSKAPNIDGVLGEDEWKEATTLKFDLPMFQLKPFAAKDKRACELRVMNSASNLYISLRVPNDTSNKTLEPLEIDMANLAFCQGKDVAKGDDRKVIFAGGYYADKHIIGPGKDEDDAQQDGQGAVAYDKGYYTFEWAVPLGSKDANDLQAKPGDEFRFNIAFIDRFRADLKGTVAGGLFGPNLDKAAAWGKLKLAADVKDDGGPSQESRKPKRDARLSCAVALVKEGDESKPFLDKPGPSFVQAYVHFESDLPDDVIFGIDQEFIEGVAKPVYLKGGDWMALVGVQRTGAVWVATGTDDTMKGKPSKDRAWKILDLGQKLKPDTWYRLRIEADFSTRYFKKFSVEGPGLSKTLDLSEYKLDYPNYMPFSDRAMSFYTFAMRGRSLMKPGAKPDGKPLVYFDDVSGGPISKDGKDTVAFNNGFEDQGEIGKQPVSLPVIDLKKYEQGRWYLERDESLVTTKKVKFAHTGDYVGVADASID